MAHAWRWPHALYLGPVAGTGPLAAQPLLRPNHSARQGAAAYYNPLTDRKAERARLIREARAALEEVVYGIVEGVRR